MRFEVHSKQKDALNYLSRQKEQQRTTLRSHPSYQARSKHNGVGVAPFDLSGFGQESPPATRTNMQRGVFLFFMGEVKGREGRVIARRQKGQAYSGFDVAHERGNDDLLKVHIGQRRRELGYSAAKESGAADPKEDLVSR